MTKNQNDNFKIVAKNRKAGFNYEILEKFEAGIILTGSEIKSAREGNLTISESFVGAMENSNNLYLFNADIALYKQASYNNHEPRRPRILLVHKSEKVKLLNSIQTKGLTIVPLTVYFNHKGLLKISIALAKGKNVIDKRETIKNRDWNIEKSRILKNFNQ